MDDSYNTIDGAAEALFKDKGSRFIAHTIHVDNEEEINAFLAGMRKKYYDATHVCYAWRLGAGGEMFRAGDDGEPSGSAGRPILGQMLSKGVTYAVIAVVRYFGGTKLGVPGLINAYREAAREALEGANIVTLTENAWYEVLFGYSAMNDVMKAVKEEQPAVYEQQFDNLCRMVVAIRRSREANLVKRLSSIEGLELNFIKYR